LGRYYRQGFGGLNYLKTPRSISRTCYFCWKMGIPLRRDRLPLHLVVLLQRFEKWEVDFIGPINPPTWHSGARYIITSTNYLTRWVEATWMQDCNMHIGAQFLFENIITRFGCPMSLTSDQGKYFINCHNWNLN